MAFKISKQPLEDQVKRDNYKKLHTDYKIPERPFEDQVKKEMADYKKTLADGKPENYDAEKEKRKRKPVKLAIFLVIAAYAAFTIIWGIRAL